MSERPDGRDLLIIAREELIKGLLPHLPNELRYQALMIANAMAIATREFETGPETSQRELLGLKQLLSRTKTDIVNAHAAVPTSQPALQSSLQPLRKMLGSAIRSGVFDPATSSHQALLQHLTTTARDKLAISNPKLLSRTIK